MTMLLAAAVLTACASVTTRVLQLDQSVRYPPTQSVDVLFEPPSRPHVTIAMLEGEGDFGIGELEVLEQLRDRARELGADAIVRTESRQWYQPPTPVYDPLYDPFFYRRRYPAFDPYGDYRLVGGGHYYTVKAQAIKYQPVAPDAPATPP